MALNLSSMTDRQVGLWLEEGKDLNRTQKAFAAVTSLRRGVCTSPGQGVGTRDVTVTVKDAFGTTKNEARRGWLEVISASAVATEGGFSNFTITDVGDGKILEGDFAAKGRVYFETASSNGTFVARITAPTGSAVAGAGIRVWAHIDMADPLMSICGALAMDDFA